MKKGVLLCFVLVLCISWMLAANASAGDRLRKHAVELGGFGGWYVMEGNQWLKDTYSAGGKLGFFWTRTFETELTMAYTPTEYKTNIIPFNFLMNDHGLDLFHFRFEGLIHLAEWWDRLVP